MKVVCDVKRKKEDAFSRRYIGMVPTCNQEFKVNLTYLSLHGRLFIVPQLNVSHRGDGRRCDRQSDIHHQLGSVHILGFCPRELITTAAIAIIPGEAAVGAGDPTAAPTDIASVVVHAGAHVTFFLKLVHLVVVL